MKNELLQQCEKAINESILSALTSYNSPLNKAVVDALSGVKPQMADMALEAVNGLVSSGDFKELMLIEIRRKMARVMISQFGGEIEKTVNTLKQNPTSRAKITLAIDNVISDMLTIKEDIK